MMSTQEVHERLMDAHTHAQQAKRAMEDFKSQVTRGDEVLEYLEGIKSDLEQAVWTVEALAEEVEAGVYQKVLTDL